MTLLFDRSGYVKVDGTEIRNLDFQFRVSRTLSPEINKASITILNVPKDLRNKWNKDNHEVEVFAGYGGNPTRIFYGDSYRVESEKQTHTWVTRLECGDGEKERQIFTNDSYNAGVKVVDVIRALAKILTIDTGNLEAQISLGIFDSSEVVNFKNGYATSGQAIEALTVILKAYDVRWSIQDKAIQILPTTGLLLDPPVVIGSVPNTGLVGSPKKTEKGGLVFRSLLQAGLIPGKRVLISSQYVDFDGRCDIVEHIGDTRGGPWYSIVEAADVNNLTAYDVDPFLQ